jgi:hypothetical protein
MNNKKSKICLENKNQKRKFDKIQKYQLKQIKDKKRGEKKEEGQAENLYLILQSTFIKR